MGKSYTPAYRLEWDGNDGHHVSAWRGKKPHLNTLLDYAQGMIDSYKIGGVNEHISQSLGFIPMPYKLTIVRQSDSKPVLTWDAPPFVIWQ